MSNKNEAAQLRDHLFKQLEKLSDPQANLEVELKRADAIAKVGTVIVNSHKQEVDYMKLHLRNGGTKKAPLKAIGAGHKKQLANG
jgi:hypothetical protein